jgi:hypothetical protein
LVQLIVIAIETQIKPTLSDRSSSGHYSSVCLGVVQTSIVQTSIIVTDVALKKIEPEGLAFNPFFWMHPARPASRPWAGS